VICAAQGVRVHLLVHQPSLRRVPQLARRMVHLRVGLKSCSAAGYPVSAFAYAARIGGAAPGRAEGDIVAPRGGGHEGD